MLRSAAIMDMGGRLRSICAEFQNDHYVLRL
jgi:hypothetical protein